MKVFRKKLIPILVHHRLFIGVVNERSYDVVFRAYSGKHRNSFIEIIFDWKECYYINLYKPLIRSVLIDYGLKAGWNPNRPNQTLVIKDSKQLIDELTLRDL